MKSRLKTISRFIIANSFLVGNIAGLGLGNINFGNGAYGGGGAYNLISGDLAANGAGRSNVASGQSSFVFANIGGAGHLNEGKGEDGYVGGDISNSALRSSSVVPGGTYNMASHDNSLVFGGTVESENVRWCKSDASNQFKICSSSVFQNQVHISDALNTARRHSSTLADAQWFWEPSTTEDKDLNVAVELETASTLSDGALAFLLVAFVGQLSVASILAYMCVYRLRKKR